MPGIFSAGTSCLGWNAVCLAWFAWPHVTGPFYWSFSFCTTLPLACQTQKCYLPFRFTHCAFILQNLENFVSSSLEALFLPRFAPHPIHPCSSGFCLVATSSRKPSLSPRLSALFHGTMHFSFKAFVLIALHSLWIFFNIFFKKKTI